MIKRVLTYWHFRKNLFVNLLAYETEYSLSSEQKIWAYYRLGMYMSVMSQEANLSDWRVLLAKIVSYASVGDSEYRDRLLEKWKRCAACQKHHIILIKALTPFMPIQSYQLAVEFNIDLDPALYVALLIKLSKKEEIEFFFKNLDNYLYIKNPELILLYSNTIVDLDNDEKLSLLNKYLTRFEIPKLTLKDKNKSISVTNLDSELLECKIIKQPLISIIMTTYNSELTIQTAINSVLKQSYKNFELIIIDDASSDNTVKIIEKYVKKDKRIKLLKMSKNSGTYISKNEGIQKAKGQFITCHDSDDYSLPLKLEKQIAPMLKNTKLIASVSDWIRVDSFGIYYSRSLYPLKRINHSSLMFKKSVIQKIGYYDSVRTGADSEFFARIKLVYGKEAVIRIKQPLSFGAHRENSLMTAIDTGYSTSGISNERLKYWESWNYWHIACTAKKKIPYRANKKDD